jgi:hypothetical protein
LKMASKRRSEELDERFPVEDAHVKVYEYWLFALSCCDWYDRQFFWSIYMCFKQRLNPLNYDYFRGSDYSFLNINQMKVFYFIFFIIFFCFWLFHVCKWFYYENCLSDPYFGWILSFTLSKTTTTNPLK